MRAAGRWEPAHTSFLLAAHERHNTPKKLHSKSNTLSCVTEKDEESTWLSFKKTSRVFIPPERSGMLSVKIIKDRTHKVGQHQHIPSHRDPAFEEVGSLHSDVHIPFWTPFLPRASAEVCLNSCWSLSHPEAQCHVSAADACAGLKARELGLFKLHGRVLIVLGAPRSGYSTFSYSNL